MEKNLNCVEQKSISQADPSLWKHLPWLYDMRWMYGLWDVWDAIVWHLRCMRCDWRMRWFVYLFFGSRTCSGRILDVSAYPRPGSAPDPGSRARSSARRRSDGGRRRPDPGPAPDRRGVQRGGEVMEGRGDLVQDRRGWRTASEAGRRPRPGWRAARMEGSDWSAAAQGCRAATKGGLAREQDSSLVNRRRFFLSQVNLRTSFEGRMWIGAGSGLRRRFFRFVMS